MADGFWPVALLLTGVLAAEVRLLRWSVAAYAAQGLLLSAVLFGLGLDSVALVGMGRWLILTALLWRYGRGEEAAGPAFGPSLVVAILLGLGAIYAADRGGTALLIMGAPLLATGAWTLLTHRDPFKQVMGLCLAENGVHAVVVSLVPHLPVTAELGIAAAVAGVVWLLLYTGRRLKEVGA